MTSSDRGSQPPPAPQEQPWNQQRLRSSNERLLLERLRAAPASRAQLARETGLSKPTVSSALAALETAGLVREAGHHTPERGRVAVLYSADPSAGYALGIDIGRAWLRVALADLDGTIVARSDVRNRARTSAAMADLVVATAHGVVADSGAVASKVAHAVVGTPGVYDTAARRVRYALHLPGWGRAGLFDRMRDELGVPLAVHNDANLAALGEYTFGVGAGSRLFVYVMIGTGLGMGIVADGRPFTGAGGAAGEIGFLPWPGREPGTLEDAVSADAVVRAARTLGMTGPLTAKSVFGAARAGHPAAVAAVRQEGERLAHTVAAVAAVLDPDLVVLGGGVGHSADLLLETVTETLRGLTPLRPRVTSSALGEDAVLLGAVATALTTARDTTFTRRG
ncbi:Sugar kinase of the NBD/HSP70 family, may contain an N-terminal HTH domain [Streptomyces sp. DvalAA-14]|uniref:ROK family transcriptional regulator n=1 Tax=unclassified Streptomyces TaxID=2593676 RepID=UPI00081B18DB|nr:MULTISPECIES: ROK family transcriptional regulator [unclassified Streptomyces]MYS21664.1 ROK family protein [Streptomyces sp. SID4948]SCD98156.1 Sugar kinase of the NBD/HSP70 family, may contain an N-terminal HTH domain [Streptomyces sp. DvalAA-14]